jgi:hypothetical protein
MKQKRPNSSFQAFWPTSSSWLDGLPPPGSWRYSWRTFIIKLTTQLGILGLLAANRKTYYGLSGKSRHFSPMPYEENDGRQMLLTIDSIGLVGRRLVLIGVQMVN